MDSRQFQRMRVPSWNDLVTEILVKAADQTTVTHTLHVTTVLNSAWHKCDKAKASYDNYTNWL